MSVRDRFEELLLRHVARYPRGEVQDLYKLVFQGCCGPEHAVAAGAAHQRLRAEAATLRELELEPMLEALPPDGMFVRVHLRPFLARGGDIDALADAFVRSAELRVEGRERLRDAWSRLVVCAERELLPCSAGVARQFGEAQSAAGFPAARHSPAYAETYFPAYRVISAGAAASLP